MERRLLVLALGMFALGTDSFVVAGVLPQIAHGFRVSVAAAGQMTTIYALTYAILAPTIAAIAAGVSRKTMLLGGLVVFVVANLATALAPSFGIALATRALAGLGAAMFAPTATGAAAVLVPPERRGAALSIVVAGLTISTALGSPIGAVIGGLGDWRWTMVFVAGLALAASIGVSLWLAHIPLPPRITLARRLMPLGDARVVATLLTQLSAMAGVFTVYTYFAVSFDRVIAHRAVTLGLLLVLFGATGTIANLITGRFIDRVGSRRVLIAVLSGLTVVMAVLPWAGASLWLAVPAIAIWGACAWTVLLPQQHRLVALAPASAPVVLGLNTSCTYLGVSAAGVIGAVALPVVGAHNLGFVGAALALGALALAEHASRRIAAARVSLTAEALMAAE